MTSPTQDPQKILQDLSIDVWERLRDVKRLAKPFKIRHGEETITDLLMLDLSRRLPNQVFLTQTPKLKEAKSGTDFELWLGDNQRGWRRLAVQAKKINLNSDNYDRLNYKVNGSKQIHLLENFAHRNVATPVYCFYNYVENPDRKRHWHCRHKSFNQEELGCTVTPLRNVAKSLKIRGARNFRWIHEREQTVPLSCLASRASVENLIAVVETQSIQSRSGQPIGRRSNEPKLYEALPFDLPSEDVIDQPKNDALSPTLRELDHGYYDPEVGMPRWICAIRTAPIEERSTTNR